MALGGEATSRPRHRRASPEAKTETKTEASTEASTETKTDASPALARASVRVPVRVPKTKQEFLMAYQELLADSQQQEIPDLKLAAEGLAHFVALLEKWNCRSQLVSQASLTEVWARHIWDSAQLAAFLPNALHPLAKASHPAPVLLDIGSGAGFPGLVLAVLVSGVEVHLLEANSKKAEFLSEAAHCLEQTTGTKLQIHCLRSEAWQGGKAEWITARAVAPLPRLLALAAPHLAVGGTCLFHQGAKQVAALAQTAQKARATNWTMQIHPSRSAAGAAILALQRQAL